MRKKEIADFIEGTLTQGRSVILVGCQGAGKWRFIKEDIAPKVKLPRMRYVDASSWRSGDYFENIARRERGYRNSIICIPDIFELQDAFAIINLLFSRKILFLATSSRLVPTNDPDYTTVAGRFESVAFPSPDYRDWRDQNEGDDPSFYLNDYPGFKGDETLLEIMRRGLRGGKRIEEQSEKMLALLKHVLSSGGKAFSYRSLSQELGYSINTVIDYVKKLQHLNLLYAIERTNLKGAIGGFLFYPTFNSFYQFSKEDLMKTENLISVYTSKLIGKLLSYDYKVCSGYLYSVKKSLSSRYRECGFVLKRDTWRTFMQIDLNYNEEKAKNLLSIKDGNPKYFAVLSGQGLQILDNGLRIVGLDRLIKGDLGEL